MSLSCLLCVSPWITGLIILCIDRGSLTYYVGCTMYWETCAIKFSSAKNIIRQYRQNFISSIYRLQNQMSFSMTLEYNMHCLDSTHNSLMILCFGLYPKIIMIGNISLNKKDSYISNRSSEYGRDEKQVLQGYGNIQQYGVKNT